jgi:hypothetical protein
MDAEALFLLKHRKLVKLETRIPADLACHWDERLDAAPLERQKVSFEVVANRKTGKSSAENLRTV